MLSVLRSPETAMADAKKGRSFVLTAAIDDINRESMMIGSEELETVMKAIS